MEQAYQIIEIEPTFLPVHQRIAKILMESGSVQQAITKYNMVANTFLARGDTGRAAGILNEVIALAPMDINLRTSLIELLEREQKWEQALDEYIHLARAYYQLADLEQARATYQEALRLASRINAPNEKRAAVLSQLADLDLSRLDLRQALRSYEQARQLNPNDEAVRRNIIDLHYRLNNAVEAVNELDNLLRLFAQQRRGDKITSTLEQLVTAMPDDMALRSRLALVYKSTNRRMEAIAQFEALAELQLVAGLQKEACASLKQLLALQPADVATYRQLMTQLGCA
jgi:tetratricopeptide (TPR) repeat protein